MCSFNLPVLCQLSCLARCWQCPYFVNFIVRGCQSEAVQPYRVWAVFVWHKTQCPQIIIKLTQFESRKLPFEYYSLRRRSFWEMSKTKMSQNFFLAYNVFTQLSWNLALWFWFCLINLTTNDAETSTCKLYYKHLHSQWVGIHVMATYLIDPNPTNCYFGDKYFSVSGSRLWSSQPVNLRTAPNVQIFKKIWKTFFFPKDF